MSVERLLAWRTAHPEKAREADRRASKAWAERNPEKVRAYSREYSRLKRAKNHKPRTTRDLKAMDPAARADLLRKENADRQRKFRANQKALRIAREQAAALASVIA